MQELLDRNDRGLPDNHRLSHLSYEKGRMDVQLPRLLRSSERQPYGDRNEFILGLDADKQARTIAESLLRFASTDEAFSGDKQKPLAISREDLGRFLERNKDGQSDDYRRYLYLYLHWDDRNVQELLNNNVLTAESLKKEKLYRKTGSATSCHE